MKEDQQNPLRMQNGSLGLGKGKIQVEHGTVSLLSECWVPASPEVKTVLQCGAWVQSLDWEDALEKEMATHSSLLAWRIRWTEKPGGL